MNTNLNKTQKALVGFGVLYLAYGTMFMGETFGLEDAGSKFLGKKAGPIQDAAAQWAGIGCLVLALDNIFVALRCSAEVGQRTVLMNAFGAVFRLGVFACQGSAKWGGTLVHKEFLQGLTITIAILFISFECIRSGLSPSKHFLLGCDGLTHGCLIIIWFLYFAYILMFLYTDFLSEQYICKGKGPLACRKAEPLAYNQMAWTVSMWMFVMWQIPQMLMAASDAEQKEFSLLRLFAVVASLWQMNREKALTPANKLTEGYVVQTVCLLVLLAAAFGDKVTGKKNKNTAAAAAKKSK